MLARLIVAGLTVTAVAGCRSFSPGCSSCGSYQTMPPTQVYPQGTIVPQQFQPTVPANGGSTAPVYQPPVDSQSSASGGTDKKVPDYDDENQPTSEGAPNYNVEPENLGSTGQPSGVELKPIEEAELEDTIEPNSIAADEPEEDAFSEPVSFKPASNSRTLSEADVPAKPAQPNPYLYDTDELDDDFNKDGVAEAYEWLRGVVDYNEKDETWQITYNADPTDKKDKYRGTFTLSNADSLYKLGLVSDDVILVDGRVDVENPDRSGKPTYRVENVKRLEPDINYASTDK